MSVESTVNSEALKQRTKQLALVVIRLCRALPPSAEGRIISRQLLRSATSVAANYRAVCRAKSTPDFVHKLRIVEEECDESLFWMEMLVDNKLVKASRLHELMQEGDEILAIVVSSAKTARSLRGA